MGLKIYFSVMIMLVIAEGVISFMKIARPDLEKILDKFMYGVIFIIFIQVVAIGIYAIWFI